MNCPFCQTEVAAGTPVCPRCRRKLPDVIPSDYTGDSASRPVNRQAAYRSREEYMAAREAMRPGAMTVRQSAVSLPSDDAPVRLVSTGRRSRRTMWIVIAAAVLLLAAAALLLAWWLDRPATVPFPDA